MTVIRYDSVYTDATTSHIREVSDDGIFREPIDPVNDGYADWISSGNIPEKVAGNPYVTINADGVTYDRVGAAAAATAAAWEQVRAQRDGLITAITWRAERYERQVAAKLPTNDTETQYLDVLLYIQALRDVTKQADPNKIEWPVMPK